MESNFARKKGSLPENLEENDKELQESTKKLVTHAAVLRKQPKKNIDNSTEVSLIDCRSYGMGATPPGCSFRASKMHFGENINEKSAIFVQKTAAYL